MRLTLFVFVIFLAGSQVYACSCSSIRVDRAAIAQSIEWHDAVFIGKVEVRERGAAALRVVRSYKGPPRGEHIVLREFTSCSVVPQSGYHLIYARAEQEDYEAGMCNPQLVIEREMFGNQMLTDVEFERLLRDSLGAYSPHAALLEHFTQPVQPETISWREILLFAGGLLCFLLVCGYMTIGSGRGFP